MEIPNCWYRNFLVEGFAFFLLGHCIRAGEDRLRIRNGLSVAVIAVFTLGCVAERRLMGRSFGVNICTIPQVAAIFLLCLKKPETGSRSLPGRILCAIGRHISLYVYVIHPFIWRFVNWLYKLGLQNAWRYMGWLKPILVLALTVAVSLVVYGVRFALSKRKPGAAA